MSDSVRKRDKWLHPRRHRRASSGSPARVGDENSSSDAVSPVPVRVSRQASPNSSGRAVAANSSGRAVSPMPVRVSRQASPDTSGRSVNTNSSSNAVPSVSVRGSSRQASPCRPGRVVDANSSSGAASSVPVRGSREASPGGTKILGAAAGADSARVAESPVPPGRVRQASPSVANIPERAASAKTPSKGAVSSVAQKKPQPGPQHSSATKSTNLALEAAINRHLDRMPEAQRRVFQKAAKELTEQNLLTKVRNYDENHARDSKFRPKAEKLSKTMHVLDIFMDGLAIAIATDPIIAGPVVGGIRVVLDIALRYFDYFAALSDMISELGDILGPLARYANSANREGLVLKTLCDVYVDLLTFCQHAHTVFASGEEERKWTSWSVFWRMQWTPFEREFGSIKQSMEHHMKVLEHATQAVGLEAILNMSQHDEEARESRKTREREEFLRWLSHLAPEQTHGEICAKRHPGTGDWLLEHPNFKKWEASRHSTLLWCSGPPGTGKSVLASYVIEHIAARHAPYKDVGHCFVFYSYNSSEMQHPDIILAALIQQLCREQDTMPRSFLQAKEAGLSASTVGTAKSFITIAREFREVFLVIDGFDECPEEARNHIFAFLGAIMEAPIVVRVLVTSRPTIDIKDNFATLRAPALEIKAKNTAADISKYVREEIQRRRGNNLGKRLHVKNDALMQTIVKTLTAQAQGMFLWVNFQIDTLCEVSQSRSDRVVEKALHTMPRGLNATYARALGQIDAKTPYLKKVGYDALCWVVHAKRSLTDRELPYAILGDDCLEEDKIDPDTINMILEACANLLVNIETTFEERRTCVFQPTHFSVHEFLTKDQSKRLKRQGEQGEEVLGESSANAYLASVCLSHLQRHIKTGPCAMDQALFQRLWYSPLLRYAACYFDQHIFDSGPLSAELFHQVSEFLARDGSFFSAILQIREFDYGHHSGSQRELPADKLKLSRPIACITDIVYATRLFEVPDLQTRWKSLPPSRFAVHRICAYGSTKALAAISTAKINVDHPDNNGTKPLYQAADKGHVTLVKMLLDRGADAGAGGGEHGTALQVASKRGHIEIVRQLLDRRVDVNVKDQDCPPPVYSASKNGHAEVVKLLLTRGGDVNAMNQDKETALLAASIWGHEQVVRALVERGADFTLKLREGKSPLHRAETASICKILLDHGMDVNSRADDGTTPLHCAANVVLPTQQHVELVGILLKNGADVKARDLSGQTALHIAIRTGTSKIVEMLLTGGADINARRKDGRTPLDLVAPDERKDVADFLARKGVGRPRASKGG